MKKWMERPSYFKKIENRFIHIFYRNKMPFKNIEMECGYGHLKRIERALKEIRRLEEENEKLKKIIKKKEQTQDLYCMNCGDNEMNVNIETTALCNSCGWDGSCGDN